MKPLVNDLTSPSLLLEGRISQCPPEKYLGNRIRLQVQVMIESIQAPTSPEIKSHGTSLGSISNFMLFNNWEPDMLHPIHVAALTADEVAINRLSNDPRSVLLSSRGFSPIHFACIGGHLSVLDLLLKSGMEANSGGGRVPTPLHCCVFFNEEEACAAAALLIAHGADPSIEIDEVDWEYHDIQPLGTPRDWAIECRHRSLNQYLLPFEKDEEYMAMIARSFFWELGGDLKEHFREAGKVPSSESHIHSVLQPIAMWIAHGANYSEAMRRTAQLCIEHDQEYGLCKGQNTNWESLMLLINNARFEDDFVLVHAYLDFLPVEEVKRQECDGRTALSDAIYRAQDKRIWTDVIQKLVNMYTIKELEVNVLARHDDPSPPSEVYLSYYKYFPTKFYPYLHWATLHESIIGARILLQKGVEVNQTCSEKNFETPFATCLGQRESADMYNLLLSYGGRMDPRDPTYCDSMLEVHLLRLENDYDFLEIAMRKEKELGTFAQSLHGAFDNAIDLFSSTSRNLPNGSEYLLGSNLTAEHINERDKLGRTLIQKSAKGLSAEVVKLLLEAGADASITFEDETSGNHLTPLEMACITGRSFNRVSYTVESKARLISKRDALPVASELLQWHHARSDGLFEGITKLHLAAYIHSEKDIRVLLDAEYNPEAKGRWPNIPYLVTPKALCRARHDYWSKQTGTQNEDVARASPESGIAPEAPCHSNDPFWDIPVWDVEELDGMDSEVKEFFLSLDFEATAERLRTIDAMLPG
ncbi:uncharacterized protein N0V89_003333 [Didymosphaeria variabile]|uniref:Ankyrin n=1 Tax=Didymosphaeria variabile TaxID=1932322 RepID=A0A9W9CFE1_9PLEO|nr:uncharacterized protein N0V89_003333 [Didymosphaeria variabile]KAJ4358749.1 hypothetical protein N0V89_003333 [Didymosphaeria variabile]